jgi:NAD-dependent DNA ligase
LYFLKKEDLVRLNKMDEDSAQGVLAAIAESRHPEPVDIIPALLATGDIPYHIGWKVAEHCGSIDDLLDDAALSRWIQPNYVTKIRDLMRDPKTFTFLDKLKRGGVIVPHSPRKSPLSPL